MAHTVRRLDTSTWDAFAELVENTWTQRERHGVAEAG